MNESDFAAAGIIVIFAAVWFAQWLRYMWGYWERAVSRSQSKRTNRD